MKKLFAFLIPLLVFLALGGVFLLSSNGGITGNVVLAAADADEDGVLDADDSCLGTPVGEAINRFGCSCSQVDIDDNNICTDDKCVAGIVTHTANGYVAPTLTVCPSDVCEGDTRITYPDSGYSSCQGTTFVAWSCDELTREKDDFCDTAGDEKTTSEIIYLEGKQGPRSPSNPTVTVTPIGVPEFSTVTLLLATLVATTGLIYMRKE